MTYRERRERRAERLREWANKREARAQSAGAAARERSDLIPFGQPILVGHHSERRHRRDLDRIDRAIGASVEHSRKAEDFRSRADSIERQAENAIYSDDDDAAEMLRERIAELEVERQAIKSYNASARKAAKRGETHGDLSLLSEELKRDLLSTIRVGFAGEGGSFPAYKLTNLGGNLNRNKKRLAALERQS